MKTFNVEIPLNAKIVVQVEAENEKEAIEKAMAENDLELHPKSNKGYDIGEWDVYTKMLEGNFWYGIIYEANAEESAW